MQYSYFEPERPEAALAALARCGEGLAPSEAAEVLLALKRLGGDPDKKAEALRFWGKVWTRRGAYYVVECRMAERPEKVRAGAAWHAARAMCCGGLRSWHVHGGAITSPRCAVATFASSGPMQRVLL